MGRRAITMTNSNQKGGVGKTVTTVCLSYVLALRGYKTLVVDMDSQGDCTEFLTAGLSDEQFEKLGLLGDEEAGDLPFAERSVFEAIQDEDAREFIVNIRENLDLLPANDDLAALSRYVLTTFTEKSPEGYIKTNEHGQVVVSLDYATALKRTLETVRDQYDVILIDTPPSLGEETVNALSASDYVNIIFETSQFSFSAINKFNETVELTQTRINPDLKLIGIIPTLINERRLESQAYIELAEEHYPGLLYQTLIKRRAKINRLPTFGLSEDKQTLETLDQFENLANEILERVGLKRGEG